MCGPNPVILQPGDIAFSFKKNSLRSKLYAQFMQSKWSHCFLIVEKTDLRTYEVENSECQVVISVFEDKYLGQDYNLEVWRPTALDETTLLQIAALGITSETQTDGYLQLITLNLRRLGGLTASEVILYPYSTVQGTPFTGMNYLNYNTEDLYEMVMSKPFEKVFSQGD